MLRSVEKIGLPLHRSYLGYCFGVLQTAMLAGFAWNGLVVEAASFPSGMTSSQAQGSIEQVALPASTKLLRSAEAYPTWPGIKVGAEIVAISLGAVASYGSPGTSFLPDMLVVPRLYLAKGLFEGLEAGVVALPLYLPETIESYGGWLKWTWQREEDAWFAAALYGTYSNLSVFRAQLYSQGAEFGAVVSKDLVRLKPYAGAGLQVMSGTITPSLLQPGAQSQHAIWAAHLFVGMEFELPANLTLQVDLWNLNPSASLLIGATF